MIKTSEQIETDKLLLSCTGLWEEFRINKTKDPINVQEYYNLISNLLDQQLNRSRMWYMIIIIYLFLSVHLF